MYVPRLPAIAFIITGIITGPALFLSGTTIPSALQAAGAGSLPVQVAQAAVAEQNLVQRVQVLLARLGYDPGPADGVIGNKTTRSVRAFQEQAGIAVDGKLSEALYLALLASVEDAARSAQTQAPPTVPTAAITAPIAAATAAAAAAQAPAETATVSWINSSWTIFDSDGSRAALTLLDEGKVSGVETPKFWRWQLSSGGIRISYNNQLGGWVNRTGRVTGEGELSGNAESSRGTRWTWTARRQE